MSAKTTNTRSQLFGTQPSTQKKPQRDEKWSMQMELDKQNEILHEQDKMIGQILNSVGRIKEHAENIRDDLDDQNRELSGMEQDVQRVQHVSDNFDLLIVCRI
jgi:archaellum component FlaC